MVQKYAGNLRCKTVLGQILLILLFSLGYPQVQLVDRVVANVNGEPVLMSELDLAQMFYSIGDRKALFDMLIEKHLIAEFLKSKGYRVPQSYLKEALTNMAKSGGKSLEELGRELESEGFSLKELGHLVELEIYSSAVFMEFLKRRVKVSDIEVELERLRKGEMRFLKEIQLLVVSKDRKDEVLKLISSGNVDPESLGKRLGIRVEVLKVGKGELIKELDREVWRTKEGGIAVAEDEENLYIAKVLRNIRVIKGRSEEEIRREIFERRLKAEADEVMKEIKKSVFVQVIGSTRTSSLTISKE